MLITEKQNPPAGPCPSAFLLAISNLVVVPVSVPIKYYVGNKSVGTVEKLVPFMIILSEADFKEFNKNFMGGNLSAGKARHATITDAWAEMVRAVDFYLAESNQKSLRKAQKILTSPGNVIPFGYPRRR